MKYEYHLTARPNKQAKDKIWYAWYLDEHGRRVYRSTGCRLKKDAIEKVKEFEGEDRRRKADNLKALAGHFFIQGKCPYLKWKRSLKPHTIYEHRHNLTEYILSKYGERIPASITAPEVETWLDEGYPKRSASWKNAVINTFRIVLTELQRDRVIEQVPEFRRPQGKRRRADALTLKEIQKLFPEDDIDLALMFTRRIARKGKQQIDSKDKAGLVFGLMFKVMLHAGMRPGEIRALTAEHVYPAFNGIHIAQQIDSTGNVSALKKAGKEDKRERLVKIPRATMDQLVRYMESQAVGKGFIFTYNNRPIRKELLESRFELGLKNAGIKKQGRRLIPYSLRFTYRSKVEGYLERQQIMDAMGHRSDEMSLHYLHVHPEQFRAMQVEQERIEAVWRD
jgi:integrase